MNDSFKSSYRGFVTKKTLFSSGCYKSFKVLDFRLWGMGVWTLEVCVSRLGPPMFSHVAKFKTTPMNSKNLSRAPV